MKVYGVTGGIGMGKSTADKILREQGVAVVDTDLIARQIVEPGQPALGEIQAVFGPTVIAEDGHLRRDELARRIFADAELRRRLEQIVHPRIRTIWQQQIAGLRSTGYPCAVVDIPLLYETDAGAHFDAIICVACSAATQRKRLQARGWSEEQISQRIAAQWPVAKKMELANYVVWTEGDLEAHAEQIKRVMMS